MDLLKYQWNGGFSDCKVFWTFIEKNTSMIGGKPRGRLLKFYMHSLGQLRYSSEEKIENHRLSLPIVPKYRGITSYIIIGDSESNYLFLAHSTEISLK